MGKYIIMISKAAEKDLSKIKKSGKNADKEKIETLFKEIEENPRVGTGKPEQLKYYDGEVWSRRINKSDRLVYEIFEEEILVIIIQALGHYSDK